MDIKNQLVTFKTAKLLKEVGYSKGSYYSYVKYHQDSPYNGNINHPLSTKKGKIDLITDLYFINSLEKESELYTDCEAPTKTEAKDFLREEYNLHVEVVINGSKIKNTGDICWAYVIYELPSEEIKTKYLNNELGKDADLFLEPNLVNAGWYYNEFDYITKP